MRSLALAAILASLTAVTPVFCSSSPAADDLRLDVDPDRVILAWIRFEDAEETYAGVPYLWLGRVNVNLRINVDPQPGHVLHILWGSKNDRRDAVAVINGKNLPVAKGGYDGFQWLEVPVPEPLPSPRYEVTFHRGRQKPGFIAAVVLTGRRETEAGPGSRTGLEQPSHKMTLSTSPPRPPEAFPEMRSLWDRQPQRETAAPDGSPEAAFREAERNSRQAAEQFFRCRRFVDGWLNRADPTTGLIPRNLTRNRDIWNAKDSAADNYPFMVLTAALTDRPLFEGRMLDMLRTETRLTSRIDRLPDTWSFSKQDFQDEKPDLGSIIFGGSEYVKDGLLPLTEWLGSSPWSERMLGIVDDIWKHAPVETPYGNVPSTNVEVNGEMLQALSRIYWMTGDEKYLRWAIRLGDYYLLGGNHPTRDFSSLRLRDHGCEIVSGLSELYVAVHFAQPEKKKAYREPIHAMFDRILEVARDDRGMLYNTINPRTGEHDQRICDTWGYNYNGVYAVYMIDRTEAYRRAVEKVLSNLREHLTDYHWGSADEYADSIEGAINLYNREPVPSAADWIDSEIKDMWSVQQPDGIVEGWHGDGNSARTAIMYAFWKTKGLSLRPWRADVRVGAVEQSGTLYVSLAADEPWAGKLLFDKPRHRVQMHLPLDYPRINQFPEWFVTEADRSYVVGDLAKHTKATYSGNQLQKGIPVKLEPGAELRLTVTPASANDLPARPVQKASQGANAMNHLGASDLAGSAGSSP